MLRGQAIDRAGERERAKVEERRRLAEALRANLRRRKAATTGGTVDRAAEKDAPTREPTGKD